MPEHELEKLLGAFAADTLTPEERQRLFTVALQDQQLFNALADEQGLKELLANPEIRRRLLESLNTSAGPSRSWLRPFTGPSGLAWAGGIAAGVFAVVLGLKVYENSLRQASYTDRSEEGTPTVSSPPPAAAPPAQAPPAIVPPPPASSDDSSGRTTARRKQPAASEPRNGSVREAEQDKTKAGSNAEMPTSTEATTSELRKFAQEPAPAQQLPARPSSPAARMGRDSPAGTGVVPSTGASARALFYDDGIPVEQIGSTPHEKEAQPMPKAERFALSRKAFDRTERVTPLALRYRSMIERPSEEAARTAESSRTVRFTVESNQDAYIQIWKRSGESLPELVLPAKDTGRISLKTTVGQRQQITVEGETDRLIVRLSRTPFGPIARQEAVMAGGGAQGQVAESVLETEGQATYVANPDPSVAELAMDIALDALVAPPR